MSVTFSISQNKNCHPNYEGLNEVEVETTPKTGEINCKTRRDVLVGIEVVGDTTKVSLIKRGLTKEESVREAALEETAKKAGKQVNNKAIPKDDFRRCPSAENKFLPEQFVDEVKKEVKKDSKPSLKSAAFSILSAVLPAAMIGTRKHSGDVMELIELAVHVPDEPVVQSVDKGKKKVKDDIKAVLPEAAAPNPFAVIPGTVTENREKSVSFLDQVIELPMCVPIEPVVQTGSPPFDKKAVQPADFHHSPAIPETGSEVAMETSIVDVKKAVREDDEPILPESVAQNLAGGLPGAVLGSREVGLLDQVIELPMCVPIEPTAQTRMHPYIKRAGRPTIFYHSPAIPEDTFYRQGSGKVKQMVKKYEEELKKSSEPNFFQRETWRRTAFKATTKGRKGIREVWVANI